MKSAVNFPPSVHVSKPTATDSCCSVRCCHSFMPALCARVTVCCAVTLPSLCTTHDLHSTSCHGLSQLEPTASWSPATLLQAVQGRQAVAGHLQVELHASASAAGLCGLKGCPENVASLVQRCWYSEQ